AGDFNADGKPDLAVAGYGQNRLYVFLGQTGPFGSFEPAAVYQPGGNPIGVATRDLNGGGRPGLARATYSGNSTSVFLGNAARLLVEDPAGSGLRSGYGRGNLSVYNQDTDFWSFTGRVGDRVKVAAENPGSPNNTGLHYTVYRPDGSYLTAFYTDQLSRGECNPGKLTD